MKFLNNAAAKPRVNQAHRARLFQGIQTFQIDTIPTTEYSFWKYT